MAELDTGLLRRSWTLNTYLTDRRAKLYEALSMPVTTLKEPQ